MQTAAPLYRQSRLRICGIVAAGFLAAGALFAQSPRIHTAINSSETAVLKGSQHPLANPQYDTGRLPGGTRLNGVTLYFSRSAAQDADLNALLAAQQDPKSPQYHRWLTPDQFAARFGVAQSDIDKVQAWLQQQGFSIDSVMRSRTGIRFSGTVAQVESAFQTQMHTYQVGGQTHFAPSSALTIPAALSGVVQGVRNLDDFRPKPQHINPRANFTSSSSGNVFFAPGDIVTAYDIKPLYSAGVNGAGQTIAIMGQSYVNVSDIEAFQSAAGLTKKDPQLVLVPGTGNDGTTSKGDESESDLDLEWSGAMAPGATIAFVYTGSNTNYGVYDSAQYAVDNLIGNIISMSYSSCETELSSSDLTTLENIFKQGASQGQTVMAASGDQGSTACYGDTNLSTVQQEAVVVNYPASSAYVTGVGGTEIASGDGAGNSTYWETASGTDVINSAKTYIPEVVWNDDSSQYGLAATGGGTSSLVAQPSWQTSYFTATGETNPDSNHRLVPDISFYSSPDAPGYLYCTSDQSAWSSSQTGSCGSGFRASSADLSLTVAGGTSFATPIFAGMVALLNQNGKYVSGSGEINASLYTLASSSATYNAAFHDVTSGNNDCTAGTQYCSATTGFSAKTGYDEATGLGSVDLAQLATVWPMNTGAGASLVASSVSVVPANANPNTGVSDTFTISVTAQSGSGTPTGTVTLQIDGGATFGGTTKGPFTLTANGTYSDSESFGTAGTHQMLVQYSGDTTFAASTGIGEVTVQGSTSGSGKFAVSLSPSTLTVSQGSSGNETLTVTPSGGYTGTVNLSYSTSNDTALQNLCLFAGTGFNTNGDLVVSGSSAASGTIQVDTNASDCASTTTGRLATHGMRLIPHGSTTHASNRKSNGSIPGGLAFAGLLLAGILGRSSRKLRGLACVIALAAVAFGLSACGSSSGSSSGPPNPPKGTYTITFTGTDSVTSTTTASGSFTLTID